MAVALSPADSATANGRARTIMTVPVAVLFLALLASGAPAGARDGVRVEVRGDRVTIQAQEASLAAVLEQLATVTGLVVHAGEPLDEPVSLELRDVPLEEALGRLLRSRNTLMVYRGDGTGGPSAVYILGGRTSPVTASPGSRLAAPPLSESDLLEAQSRADAELIATLPYSAARVDELDEELRRLVGDGSQYVAGWLEGLLVDPHPGARLMALHGMEERRALDLSRLAAAFKDPDLAVQQGALQILISRGASDQAVETVREAAAVQDEATLRQLMLEAISP